MITYFRDLKLSYKQMTCHLPTPSKGKLRQNENPNPRKFLPHSEEKPRFSLQSTRPCTICFITPTCPPLLSSLLLPTPLFESPLLPLLTLLQLPWAPGYSLNNSGTILAQDLCTGCSLYLERSFLTIYLAPSLPPSNLCITITFSVRHLLIVLLKIASNTLYPLVFYFSFILITIQHIRCFIYLFLIIFFLSPPHPT